MSSNFFQQRIVRSSGSETEIFDLTDEVSEIVARSGIRDGLLNLFVPGSTASLTTIEYEPGAVSDLLEAIEKIAPRDSVYRHNERWGDGNGFSHVRAALLGPSLTVPLTNGELLLGTWQQIILCDFDNKPRQRQVVVTAIGA
jgi:secondary thiamine-phosphate synthase enzyme